MSFVRRTIYSTFLLMLSANASLERLFLANPPSNRPSLDPNNIDQLKEAAKMAMTNLMSYYTPNSRGTFDERFIPWHESSMIWGMHFDYASWTGDRQFLETVTQAVAHQAHDSNYSFIIPGVTGQWNDDPLWPGQAAIAAAELFGPSSTLPGGNETWLNLSQKTLQETSTPDQMDDKCGGGIYWYRDRSDRKGKYKSLITHLEFISLSARTYILEKDPKILDLAKVLLNWIQSSGLANPQTGVLLDGVGIDNCSDPTTLQWSYNYGMMAGSLAWMHRATNDAQYLQMASSFLDYSQRTFANTNTSGVVTELCEPDDCNRDQLGFKAIYVRGLAYLYREATNVTMKGTIHKIIRTSLDSMAKHSCDAKWVCGGNWTTDGNDAKTVRSQHVSTALLVAAVGITSDAKNDQYGS